jgi:limonene-1,2-epoxide hydrolase
MDETLADTIAAPLVPSNVQIADTYLDAYRSKDPSRVQLATDVTLQYPLSPVKVVGKQNVIDYMRSMMPAFDSVELEHHVAQNDHVVTVWKAHTAWGIISCCTVFRIASGKIAEVRTYFDPRPIVQRD